MPSWRNMDSTPGLCCATNARMQCAGQSGSTGIQAGQAAIPACPGRQDCFPPRSTEVGQFTVGMSPFTVFALRCPASLTAGLRCCSPTTGTVRPGGGNPRSLVLVGKIVAHLGQQLFVGIEILGLFAFLEKGLVLVGPLRKHESTASRYLHASLCLQVAIDFAEKSKIDIEGTGGPRINHPPTDNAVQREDPGKCGLRRPVRSPHPHGRPVCSQELHGTMSFWFVWRR